MKSTKSYSIPYLILFLTFCCPMILSAQQLTSQVLSDTRTFEVSATSPMKDYLVTAWMEKRPERKDNDENADDMRVAYRSTKNAGKTWSEKQIIDLPNTMATGNPYVASGSKKDTYLVCMHIGLDFFSGNISLYEFDRKKQQFILKSVPVKSDSQLLDKPSIAVYANEIHLVYNTYEKNMSNAIKYQMSKDGGNTWTDPVNVFKSGSVRYLGPSIALSKNNQVSVSAGSYGRRIYTTKKIAGDVSTFEEAKEISQKNFMGMTELSVNGTNMILTWQDAHQLNVTGLTISADNGSTWKEPFILSKKGNLLSANMDEERRIHLIFAEYVDQKYSVEYRIIDTAFNVLNSKRLLEPTGPLTLKEYLGAYQKLLIASGHCYAFWIDYPNEHALKFSKWKID